jgi:hypothetical protein
MELRLDLSLYPFISLPPFCHQLLSCLGYSIINADCSAEEKTRPSIYRGENATYENFFWVFWDVEFCKLLRNKDKKNIKLF